MRSMEAESVAEVIKRAFPDAAESFRSDVVARFHDRCGATTGRDMKRLRPSSINVAPDVVDTLVGEGVFVSKERERDFERATAIVEVIKSLPSVSFEKVQTFRNVPWPSLQGLPPRISAAPPSADGVLFLDTLVGREGLGPLLQEFMGIEASPKVSKALELAGTVGCGKTHLVLMLAIRCIHDFANANRNGGAKPQRMVYVSGVDSNGLLTLKRFQSALLVAFWNDRVVQRKISMASDWDALQRLVESVIDVENDMYYVFDDWDRLDDNIPLRQKLEELTSHRPSIYCGGSAQDDPRTPILRHTPYNFSEPLSTAELTAYLGKEDENKDRWYLTGNLPLFVRLYNEVVDSEFVEKHEVAVMIGELERLVQEVALLPDVARKTRVERLLRIVAGKGKWADLVDMDTRWVVSSKQGSNVKMACHLAAQTLVAAMQRLLPQADNVVIQNALQVCKSEHLLADLHHRCGLL